MVLGGVLLACQAPTPIVDDSDPDACGDIPGQPRRFAALAPDERLERIVAPSQPEGRAVFEISRSPTRQPGAPRPKAVPQRLISTDHCGDDELSLPGVVVAAVTDDVILSCAPDTGTVFVVDPEQEEARRTLLTGVECEVAIAGSDAVALALDGDLPRAVTVPLAGGAPRTLLASVAPLDPLPLAVSDGTLTGLTPAGRLVTVDVATAEVFEQRDDVADVRVSGDGRWLLLQQGTPNPEERVVGPVVLVDRRTDLEVVLAQTSLSWSPHPWFSELVLLTTEPGAPVRVFTLEGAELVLPEATQLRGVVGDGRLWIGAVPLSYGRLQERTWDPKTSTATLVYDGEGFATGSDGGLFVHIPSAEFGIQLGTLLEVPWSGGQPTVAAEGIGWHRRRLADGRWLSVVADDDGDHGALVIHDTDGGRRVVDEDAHVFSPALAGKRAADDPIVYAVSDGPRSGLHRLALSDDPAG